MRFSVLVSLVGLAVGAFAQSSTADAWVASESPIAKAGLLANIGASGSKAAGAKVSPAPDARPPALVALLVACTAWSTNT